MDALFWLFWTLALLAPPAIVLAWYTASLNARRRRLRQLDEAWAWIGDGERHHGDGREWVGVVDGRRVDVDWFDGTTTVTVEASPRVQVGFVRRDEPADLVSQAEHSRPVELGDMVAFAPDERGATAVVAKPEVREAIEVLLDKEEGSETLRAVEVDPRRGVSWFARNLPRSISREEAERWVRAVIAVARGAESV